MKKENYTNTVRSRRIVQEDGFFGFILFNTDN